MFPLRVPFGRDVQGSEGLCLALSPAYRSNRMSFLRCFEVPEVIEQSRLLYFDGEGVFLVALEF